MESELLRRHGRSCLRCNRSQVYRNAKGPRCMMRSYVFRLYPTKVQIVALDGQLAGACDLYNAALQERRDAYRRAGVSLNYYHQAACLKDMRAEGLIDVAN